jgi:hypothetical protein
MVGPRVKPPQGRIEIGWRVSTADGRRGEVVGERLVAPNGGWYYLVVFDDGGRQELPDYALRRLQSSLEPDVPGGAPDEG